MEALSVEWQCLFEQRLNTLIQQQWLPKLLEFDYEIQHKEGKGNLVSDALSRKEGSEVFSMALSIIESNLLKGIKEGYVEDVALAMLIAELQSNPNAKKHYTLIHDLLRGKGKLVVANKVALRDNILSGHSGREATHQRSLFYLKGATKNIQYFNRSCAICQQWKYDNSPYPGLIQPLPILESVWFDMSMDFIHGLPLSFGKSVLLVVVD
ncbi:LOW QUALITY PROTEIN: hypothetical protein V2J09_011070 [Rumex salicifolius]